MTIASAPHDYSFYAQTATCLRTHVCGSLPAEPLSVKLWIMLDLPWSTMKFLAESGKWGKRPPIQAGGSLRGVLHITDRLREYYYTFTHELTIPAQNCITNITSILL